MPINRPDSMQQRLAQRQIGPVGGAMGRQPGAFQGTIEERRAASAAQNQAQAASQQQRLAQRAAMQAAVRPDVNPQKRMNARRRNQQATPQQNAQGLYVSNPVAQGNVIQTTPAAAQAGRHAVPRTFKKGGEVKKGGMAKVHKGEHVLTAKQAKDKNIQKAIKKSPATPKSQMKPVAKRKK